MQPLFLIDEESGSEEDTLQYFSAVDPNYRSRRKKKLDSQNKNSQSLLSVLLCINHGLVAVFTDVKVRIYKSKSVFSSVLAYSSNCATSTHPVAEVVCGGFRAW